VHQLADVLVTHSALLEATPRASRHMWLLYITYQIPKPPDPEMPSRPDTPKRSPHRASLSSISLVYLVMHLHGSKFFCHCKSVTPR
jgi:hypothetical protein